MDGVHGNATGTWGYLAGFVGLVGPLLLFHFHFLSSSSSAYSSFSARLPHAVRSIFGGAVFTFIIYCRSSKRTLSGCFVSLPGLELGLVKYCFCFNSFCRLCFCSIREWRDGERRKSSSWLD